MATEAARLDGNKIHISKNKTVLTLTGLLMEGLSTTEPAFRRAVWVRHWL